MGFTIVMEDLGRTKQVIKWVKWKNHQLLSFTFLSLSIALCKYLLSLSQAYIYNNQACDTVQQLPGNKLPFQPF